jgi:hypothetical protein
VLADNAAMACVGVDRPQAPTALSRWNQSERVDNLRASGWQFVIAIVVAISDPWWPSIFTIHFETLIPGPALCNARARIYGVITARNRAPNPHLGDFL